MSDKKSQIRKIITIAVFVLLLIGAVYFYFSAPDNPGNSGSSYDFSLNSEYSDNPDIIDSSVSSADNSAPHPEQPSSTQTSSSFYDSSVSSADNSAPHPEQPSSTQTSSSFYDSSAISSETHYIELKFRNSNLLNQHYEKHGKEMGFSSAEEYENAAAAVPLHPDVLHKTEKEDGDDVYYIEATNEFVVVSTDGYIRTYFLPDSGKSYYDRQ